MYGCDTRTKKDLWKMRNKLQMEKTMEKTGYSVWFTRAVLLSSMLSVFPLRIAGMEALAIILFLLCIFWMLMDIWQISRGRKRKHSNYRRLDVMVLVFLLYEVGLIAVSLMQEIGENDPEPDYSWNLMVIGLALLYLLVMEAGTFRAEYLDMILYGGLVVMAVLLLGYLFDPSMGESVRLWENRTATASYLIMVGLVGALQYCWCEERMKRIFYVMCAGLAFFLLACNHSVISFWIVVYALLTIPVLVRPTADLCKSAMQMLFLFLVIISSMGLLGRESGLLLTEVSYDAEHSVCLDMAGAAVGLLFFYCWYRKPEGVSGKKIVMRGFYKLDKLMLRGILLVFGLFSAGGEVWETLDDERFGLRGVSGFAVPLVEEIGQNHSLIYLCLREQGAIGAILCIVVLVLFMERINRAFGWDKPTKGMLCVIAVSLLPQILLWKMVPNVLPVAVILTGGMIGTGRKQEKTEAERQKKIETPERKIAKTEEMEIEEIRMEMPKKEEGAGRRKKVNRKKGKGRVRR